MVFLYSMFLGFSHIFFVAVYLSPLLNLCLPSFYIFLGEIRNVKSTMIMKNTILFYRHTNVFLIIMIGLLFIRCSSSSSGDRKSTRLNSSHVAISYAVFCLKKKKTFLLVMYRSLYTIFTILLSIA